VLLVSLGVYRPGAAYVSPKKVTMEDDLLLVVSKSKASDSNVNRASKSLQPLLVMGFELLDPGHATYNMGFRSR
jgi:hypothetical protein